ncbi:MAG: T9SS type A sorting domain-containing protein [Brumimicrobium sp.]|nr:T9SS type A sorting domain-containing protein [Brumimicrobium sp.]
MKFYVLLVAFISLSLLNNTSFAQNYTYHHTGDTSDITTTTIAGICLMGGATENDEGSTWFLNRSGGGNIVVLRTSGSDGYNNYFYSQLGVIVQSVETIVFNNSAAANDPFVLRRIQQAEAIWLAGGDQYLYESYWKNTDVQNLLNDHIQVKKAPIGGTSAGMAILGDYYFSAENGTITSTDAMNNPYDNKITIGTDFIQAPFLVNTITDTHYDNPDRKGRHVTFLARMQETDNSQDYFGIAADEYVAICIDENGIASVYGEYPTYDDNAFFLRTNCERTVPSVLTPSTPLTWQHSNGTVLSCNIKGVQNGTNRFDLVNFVELDAADWSAWNVDAGNLQTSPIVFTPCTNNIPGVDPYPVRIYPNPSASVIYIEGTKDLKRIILTDLLGKELKSVENSNEINISEFENGNYYLKTEYYEMDFKLYKVTIIK